MAKSGREQPPEAQRPLRRAEAARYVQDRWGYPCTKATLAKLAVIGGGPLFRRAGRYPLYEPAQLDQWIQSKLSRTVKSPFELTEANHAG